MKMTWEIVKEEIEEELDRIWFTPPEEIVMVMQGNLPSGANIDGSPMGYMYYQTFETSKIGRHVVNPAINAALDDDVISLETIKKMWVYLSDQTVTRMGGSLIPENEAWMNLGNVKKIWDQIKNVLPEIQSKKELWEIFYSWINYLTCLNMWAYILFPWEIAWYDDRVRACKRRKSELFHNTKEYRKSSATKNWREVKEEIEDELDRIWFIPPEEIVAAMKGYFPSGAGVDGSAFGNMYFLTTDTNKIGRHVVEPAIYELLEDTVVSLEEIKHFWKYLTRGTATILGDVSEPECPAPWLNLEGVCYFYHEIAESLATVQTKDELREILYSWFNYLTCLNYWARILFPWELIWYDESILHGNGGEKKVRS